MFMCASLFLLKRRVNTWPLPFPKTHIKTNDKTNTNLVQNTYAADFTYFTRESYNNLANKKYFRLNAPKISLICEHARMYEICIKYDAGDCRCTCCTRLVFVLPFLCMCLCVYIFNLLRKMFSFIIVIVVYSLTLFGYHSNLLIIRLVYDMLLTRS